MKLTTHHLLFLLIYVVPEEFCVLLIAATNATKDDTQNTIDHTVLTPWDAFQLFDEDGSNSIDFEEFNALCDYCGLRNIDEKQRMKNFKQFDEDGGGTLSFQEFKLCWVLMTNPFHQAAAHGFEVKKYDTAAEMREKVMYRLEKLEEKDQISLVDAYRWVDYHREKMRMEREARDKKITSREYWATLPGSAWTMKLMIESLAKMGYDAAGKKEELEHRIRSYVNDAKTFEAWLWEVVEAVLAMTDSGFESWGGVYTCGHGANGQLGRPCDAITSELSGDACDLRAAGSRIVSGGWHNNDNEARSNTRDRHVDNIKRPDQHKRLFEGRGGVDMYSNFHEQPFIGIPSGAQQPQPNSSPTFQSIESLSSKGVDRIFASFCSELAFVQTTATGELWMLGGKKGKIRDYPIPIEEPQVDLSLKDKPGSIYLSEAQRNPTEGLPYETFDTPTQIVCFENQRLLSLGIGRNHCLAVPETTDLYCWGSNTHGQLGLIGSTRLNEGALDPSRDTVLIKIPKRKGGSVVTGASSASTPVIGDDELLDRDEDPKIAAQQEEEFLRRPGGPILPNGSQTKAIDVARGIVVRHSGHGRTVVKDIGGRRTFFWDNESYLKEADQAMPTILDSIVGKGLQTSCVACGPTHSVCISSGRMYSFGAGPDINLGRSLKSRRHLGAPWSTHSPTPKLVDMPPGLRRVTMSLVAAGASHTVAISADGRLFSWGGTDGGRRSHRKQNTILPTPNFPPRITSRTIGSSRTTASQDPSVTSFNLEDSVRGDRHSVSSQQSGRDAASTQGTSATAKPTSEQHVSPSWRPRQIDVSGRRAFDVAAGSWHTIVILEVSNADFPGAQDRASRILSTSQRKGGRDPVPGDKPVGVIYSWGNGRFGQLGRGMSPAEQQYSDPRPVGILGGQGFGGRVSSGILSRKICCGSNHCAALTAAGTVWTWGFNRHGCLGRPTKMPVILKTPRKAPGRDFTPTKTTHTGVGSIETYRTNSSTRAYQGPNDTRHLVSALPRPVGDLTGFPRGRVLDIGCGADFTVVCTAPWTGIGPMQMAELEDCASRVLQALGRKFLSVLRARKRSRKEYSKVWHLTKQRFFYRHDPTGERSWQRPITVGSSDAGIRIIKGTQQIPSIQNHAEDIIQQGPFRGAFQDGSPGIPYDEHAVILNDWNHTRPYRRLDPLRISLADGRTDRSWWHGGARTMGALPAEQYCKDRKPPPIPKLKNGDDGEEAFLKSIMEPACRVCKLCRRRGGFRPSAHNLFLCANCNHHKFYHGRRNHPMAPEEAVRKIQQIWRTYAANMMIRRLIKSIYEKHWHSEKNAWFYYNRTTEKSQWTKPLLLGSHDLVAATPKPENKAEPTLELPDERRKLFTASDYDTESDQEDGNEAQNSGYSISMEHESRTNDQQESVTKREKRRKGKELLAWLANEATAEEREAFQEEVEKTRKRRRKRLKRKKKKAATAIQNVWKVFQARQELATLLRSIYEKTWSSEHGAFYWYSKNTGESTWERPKLLSKIGDVTPRFDDNR